MDVQFSAFGHASRRLATWHTVLGPMVFKVGIAADPDHRFWNPEFGYHTERTWLLMEVLWQGPANQMRNLEVCVIDAVQSLPGCRNESPGGEGVRADRVHECFLYIVVAPCGHGMGLEHAWSLVSNRRKNVSNVGRAARHRGESAGGIGARAASGGVGERCRGEWVGGIRG